MSVNCWSSNNRFTGQRIGRGINQATLKINDLNFFFIASDKKKILVIIYQP